MVLRSPQETLPVCAAAQPVLQASPYIKLIPRYKI
jgi:hypothetical protein